jgi:hypothetical protein
VLALAKPKPVPALPSSSGEPIVCTEPRGLDDLCPCLLREADLGDACGFVGPAIVRGARLLRVGGGQQTVVYLAVDGPGGWRIVHEVAWEQNHGRRGSKMQPLLQKQLRLGAARVYRLDYVYDEGIMESDDRALNIRRTMALLCPLDGVAGAPRCTVELTVRCDAREEGDPPRHTVGTAELAISSDGVATLTRTAPAEGPTCLERLGAHRIW